MTCFPGARRWVSSAVVCAVVVSLCLPSRTAPAAIIVNAVETAGNVVISGGGTADLTDLTFSFVSGAQGAGVRPSAAWVFTAGSTNSQDVYFLTSGPSNFGPGALAAASFSSGDALGILDNGSTLRVSPGYVSGNPLNSSMTFNSATFASLGMTPGQYVWSWGSGAHADSYTLNIQVPEPASLVLMALAVPIVVKLRNLRRNTRTAAAL